LRDRHVQPLDVAAGVHAELLAEPAPPPVVPAQRPAVRPRCSATIICPTSRSRVVGHRQLDELVHDLGVAAESQLDVQLVLLGGQPRDSRP
jgi:hypothetical protein